MSSTKVPGYFHGVPLGRENEISGLDLHLVTFSTRMTKKPKRNRIQTVTAKTAQTTPKNVSTTDN
jgi:hypothetical protein